jgi:hypothetical protein
VGLFDAGKTGLKWKIENFTHPRIWPFSRKEFPVNAMVLVALIQIQLSR